jgi:hypothetical protein
VLDDVVVDASTGNQGECPSCGLGWTESALVVSRRSTAPPSAADERRQRKALARRDRDRDAAVSDCRFSSYGLDDSWSGRRWLGGWGRRNNLLDRLELGHGDAWDDDAALVRITAWSDATTADLRFRDRIAAQNLAQHLWMQTGTHSDAVQSTFGAEDPTGSWDPLTLSVDGEATTFRSLRVGTSWVAHSGGDPDLITLSARHVEPSDIALVTVADLAPYLADDGMPR